jgi:hypothetical protein
LLQRFADACAAFSVRRRWPILVASAVFFLVAIHPAVFIPRDAAYEIWFLDSDPTLLAYHDFQDFFGNDEFLLIVLEVPEGTVFTNEALASLVRLDRFLKDAPYVQAVTGLPGFERLRGDGDLLDVEPAIPELPLDSAALEYVREWVLGDPLAVGSVVSPDGALAVTAVELEHRPGEYLHRLELVERIEGFVEEEAARSGLTYRLTGGAVFDRDIYEKTSRDFQRNVVVVTGFIFVFLLITMRSVSGSVLPIAVVLLAVVAARVAIPLLGWKDNNMLMLVPLVVLAIGVADSVHIVVHFLRVRGEGASGPEAARRSVSRLFKPCLLTSVTTAVGFLALQTASLAPLRQLGMLTGIGVMVAFAFSVVTLPAALSLLPGNPASRHARLEAGFFSRMVEALPGFVESRRRIIFAAAGLLSLAGIWGITRLHVETNALELFREDDPIRVTTEELEDKAGGIGSLEIVVHSADEGGIRDPEILAAMDAFGAFLEKQPLVTGTLSVTDYLKTVNQAMHGGADEAFRIPETGALAAQYLLLYEAADPARSLDRLLDITHSHARISARTRAGGSSEYKELQAAAEAFAAERFPPEVSIDYTGVITLYKNMGDYIIWSQIRSFLFALLIITVAMMIAFRSVVIGLLSLIPNVWPIALTLGFMGWRDIWLEPSTAMIAAVSIGIAVDDSVHFLSRYLEAERAGSPPREAVDKAFNLSGRAIVFTTVILLAGFFAISLSSFKPYVNFGLLCGIAILLALAGDLLILPAIFLGRRRPSRPAAAEPRRAAVTGTLLLFAAGAAAMPLAALADPGPRPPLLAQAPVEGPPPDASGRGRAIMAAVETATAGEAEHATMEMILSDDGGREVERKAELYVRETGDGRTQSLIRFLEPTDLRGTAFLTHERPGPDDQWLYLPGLERVKRIASSRRTGSFAGTQFTYEDLSGRAVDDYAHRYAGADTLDGEPADVVESVPREEDSGYSRLVSWVSREKPVFLRVDYYDRRERLLKRSTAEGFTRVEGGGWRADTLTMKNEQNGKATVMRILAREVGLEPDPVLFSVEGLKSW